MRCIAKPLITLSLTILVLLGVSGCSSLKKENAYLASRNGNKLVVPPPLTRRYINDDFVLPNVSASKRPPVSPPTV